MPENLEIKLKASNLSKLESIVRSIGRLVYSGIQTDTYFKVSQGRLKLRETPKGSELIFYQRPNRARARWSSYATVKIEDPKNMKSFLGQLLGAKQVVRKYRKVYLYRNARIHLDRVEGLGNFIEVEVIRRGKRMEARKLMGFLCKKLELNGQRTVEGSYADLRASLRGRN